MTNLKNQSGFSLVEIMISVGLMAAGALALASMGGNSTKQMNGLEFKLLREQYKMQTMSQFLNTPHSCKCLFKNIEFQKAPVSKINDAGDAGTLGLGVYTEDCSSVPSPYLQSTYGGDGVRAKYIKLMDVEFINNAYYGNLAVLLESKKDMMGDTVRGFKLPVALKVTAGSTPTKVKVDGCSLASGESAASPFKFPGKGEAGWKIPLNPANGDFKFSALPETASGVFIQYTVGSPANGRSDRNCDITGADISIKLGTDSKGDGGQRYVAGTAYVPMDGCDTAMKYSCRNKSNRGEFKILAYIDDGVRPDCGGTRVECPSGQVPDGLGGCAMLYDDESECPPGTKYSEETNTCKTEVVVTCTPPAFEVAGQCVDFGSIF